MDEREGWMRERERGMDERKRRMDERRMDEREEGWMSGRDR